jgi:hypothetical protein
LAAVADTVSVAGLLAPTVLLLTLVDIQLTSATIPIATGLLPVVVRRTVCGEGV